MNAQKLLFLPELASAAMHPDHAVQLVTFVRELAAPHNRYVAARVDDLQRDPPIDAVRLQLDADGDGVRCGERGTLAGDHS